MTAAAVLAPLLVASNAAAQRAFDCNSDVVRKSTMRALAKFKGQKDPFPPNVLDATWWPEPIDIMKTNGPGSSVGRVKVTGRNLVFYANTANWARMTRVLVDPITKETTKPARQLGLTVCGYLDAATAKTPLDLALRDAMAKTEKNTTDLWFVDGKRFPTPLRASYVVILSPSWFNGDFEYEIRTTSSGTD